MKATGIVRRIDDLGRVVIPKEIRRTMRIREGDPLEIYTDREGEVIFKKYSPLGELTGFAAQYADTLHKTCGLSVLITDRDAVIAVAGASRKEYADKALSPEIDQIMEGRGMYVHADGHEAVYPTKDAHAHGVRCAMPIVSEGDVLGCVISLFDEGAKGQGTLDGDVESKLVQTAASFLGKQLEN